MRNRLALAFVVIVSLLLFLSLPVWAGKPVKTFTHIGPAEKEQIKKNMIAEGYTETISALLINLLQLDGKTAYQFGDTLYLGSQSDIMAGNYIVSGRNIFAEHNQSWAYVIEYKDKLPLMALMTNNSCIVFMNGSINHFTVTKVSQDLQREYTAEYKTDPSDLHVPDPLKIKLGIRPKLLRSVLKLKAFGAVLLYDSEGNLTPESRRELLKGSKDFSCSIIPGKDAKTMKTGIGFCLKSRKTGKEEQYSFSGRRILEDTHSVLSSNDQREVIEKDVKQEIILYFSKYGETAGLGVAFNNIYKQHTEVIVTEGKITKTLIKTGELCENPQKIIF